VITVEQQLEKKLKHLRVHIDAPDDDTILLRNVPIDGLYFNKPRTNLLIKRPREGLPYLICVDEDLEYLGPDPQVARAFVAGHKQQGWRALMIGRASETNIQTVIKQALGAVGFDGKSPELQPSLPAPESGNPGKVLSSFSTDLSIDSIDEPTIGREEQIEDVISCLLQWQTRLPLIVGESGVGKTNLIRATARRLKGIRPDLRVAVIELGALMSGTLFDSERENLLTTLLKDLETQPRTILAIEHFEMALIGVPRGHLLIGEALDRGARLIGTTLPSFVDRFAVAPLSRRLQMITLEEMSLRETGDVLAALRERIAAHHNIQIEESLLNVIIDSALGLTGQLPSKAIALLDSASAHAGLAGDCELGAFDIYATVGRMRGEDCQPFVAS
jgi:ATP-dependent Clp protease ATP-binding subunit ClpA